MINDERRNRENEIFREEVKKAEEWQKERDRAHDKSIGGDALRPPDHVIDHLMGEDQNRDELIAEAVLKTEKRMVQEDAKLESCKAHERADRAQTNPEQQSPEIKRGIENAKEISERMKQKGEERLQAEAPDKRQQLIEQMRQKREQGRQRKR